MGLTHGRMVGQKLPNGELADVMGKYKTSLVELSALTKGRNVVLLALDRDAAGMQITGDGLGDLLSSYLKQSDALQNVWGVQEVIAFTPIKYSQSATRYRALPNGGRFEGTIVNLYIDPDAALTKKLDLLLQTPGTYAQTKSAALLVENGVVKWSCVVDYETYMTVPQNCMDAPAHEVQTDKAINPQIVTAEALMASLSNPDGLPQPEQQGGYKAAAHEGGFVESVRTGMHIGARGGLDVATAPGAIVGAGIGALSGVGNSAVAAAECEPARFVLGPIQGLVEGGAKGGMLTRGVLGAPCAVVGGAIGAVSGGVSAIAGGIKQLVSSLPNSLPAGGKTEGVEPTARAELLLPLLSVAAAATQLGMLSEEEARDEIMAALADCKTWQDQPDKAIDSLPVRARNLLCFAKLRQCYPDASTADVRAVAARVVGELPADVVDACWIACGTRPPSQWSSEGKALLPPLVTNMQSGVLLEGLNGFYDRFSHKLASALSSRFPQGDADVAGQVVGELKEKLSMTHFWKGAALLMSECPLPQETAAMPLTDLTKPDVLKKMRAFLDGSLALCPEEMAAEMATEN